MEEVAYGITDMYDAPNELLAWGEIRGKGSNICVDSMGHKGRKVSSLDADKAFVKIMMAPQNPGIVTNREGTNSSESTLVALLLRIFNVSIQRGMH